MKSILKLLIINFLIFYSCSSSNHENLNFTEGSFNETFNLTSGNKFKNDSLFLGKPMFISFHPDSFLLFTDVGKNLVKIIDLKSNKIQEIIPQGKGPGELITAWGIEIQGKDVYVFCVQLGKVIILTPDSNRKFKITYEFNLEEKGSFRFYPLKRDFFVCLSKIGDEKRLTFINEKGRILRKIGDYPPFLNNTKIKGDNNIFQSHITASPDGKMILLACSQTDILEIYDVDKGLKKRFQGPIGIQLSVTNQKAGIGQAMRLEPSYGTYCFSKANINEFGVGYVGYNFKKGKRPSRSDTSPKQIFCFDWNGKPLRKISFNSYFSGFDVDWDGKVLYLLEWENENPEIVSYSLKDILK